MAMGLFTSIISYACNPSFLKSSPCAIFIPIHLIIFYQIRYLTIYIFPDSSFSFFNITGLENSEHRQTVYFICFCVVAMIIGLKLGRRFFGQAIPISTLINEPKSRFVPSVAVSEKLFYIVVILKSLAYVTMGGGEYVQHSSAILKIIDLITHLDVFLLLYFICADLENRLNSSRTVYIVLVYIFARVFLMASRSGFVDAFVALLAWRSLWYGMVYVPSIWRVVMGLVLSGSISFALYFLVVILRHSRYDFGEDATIGGKLLSEIVRFRDVSVDVYVVMFQQVIYRLGTAYDATAFLLHGDYDREFAQGLVNLTQTFVASARRLTHIDAIGSPTFTEFGFAEIIGNYGYYVGDNLVSVGYTWGAFGLSYHLMGTVGGVLLCGFIAFLLGGGTNRLTRVRRFKYFHCVSALLLVLSFQAWVLAFGIDNILDRHSRYFVVFAFTAMVIRMAKVRRIGSLTRLTQAKRVTIVYKS